MPQALIWGASGGIGSALVRTLKSAGWHVYAAAREESRIPPKADLMSAFRADSEYSIQATVARIAYESSELDLVVYAAGGLQAATVSDLSAADWQAVLDANLTGAYLCAKHSLPLLKADGHMLFMGAYTDKITLPRFAAYAGAKAALETFVAVLAQENRRQKFTLVKVGAVDTPFWHSVPFALPKTALSAESVAAQLLEHFNSGHGGVLEL